MILHCEYAHNGVELDAELKKAIGKDCCSSGFTVPTFVRDIQFEFDCLKQLKAAQDKIRNNPKLSSVTFKAQD